MIWNKWKKNEEKNRGALHLKVRKDDLIFCRYWVGDEAIFYFKWPEGVTWRFFFFAVLKGLRNNYPFSRFWRDCDTVFNFGDLWEIIRKDFSFTVSRLWTDDKTILGLRDIAEFERIFQIVDTERKTRRFFVLAVFLYVLKLFKSADSEVFRGRSFILTILQAGWGGGEMAFDCDNIKKGAKANFLFIDELSSFFLTPLPLGTLDVKYLVRQPKGATQLYFSLWNTLS